MRDDHGAGPSCNIKSGGMATRWKMDLTLRQEEKKMK